MLIERTWALEARAESTDLGFTHREIEIIGLLASGLIASAIGARLGITHSTVNKHLEHIYRKLDVNDRMTAVNRARELGMLRTPVSVTHHA